MDKTLMVLGLGGVGTYAAHLAGRLPGVRVAVGDIRADHARRVANSLIADSIFCRNTGGFPMWPVSASTCWIRRPLPRPWNATGRT